MEIIIKENHNTIYEKVYYWVSSKGFKISLVKVKNVPLSEPELKEALKESVEKYIKKHGA